MSHVWTEDEAHPRVDTLAADLTAATESLPAAHPQWFRTGDIVRIGEDELYDSGERDEYGQPILYATNEAVKVIDAGTMWITRAIGANPARPAKRGDLLFIIANEP